MTVVHDFMADIDRGAEFLERPLDDLDRPDHPRTEPPRLSHKNPHPDQFLPSASSRSDIAIVDCLKRNSGIAITVRSRQRASPVSDQVDRACQSGLLQI